MRAAATISSCGGADGPADPRTTIRCTSLAATGSCTDAPEAETSAGGAGGMTSGGRAGPAGGGEMGAVSAPGAAPIVPPGASMVIVAEDEAANGRGEPKGSLRPPSSGSTAMTIGRRAGLSTRKRMVPSRPEPPAPGGAGPAVTQPTRTLMRSNTGARQVTGRPVLPRNDPLE
jgi:hypothetical protein